MTDADIDRVYAMISAILGSIAGFNIPPFQRKKSTSRYTITTEPKAPIILSIMSTNSFSNNIFLFHYFRKYVHILLSSSRREQSVCAGTDQSITQSENSTRTAGGDDS